MLKHDGSVFLRPFFALFKSDHSGHVVVQHLAEASPPALGISARRQSVEFQKLIGSEMDMVGSGYLFRNNLTSQKTGLEQRAITFYLKISWSGPDVF